VRDAPAWVVTEPVGDTTAGRPNTPIEMPGFIDIRHIYEVATAWALRRDRSSRTVTRSTMERGPLTARTLGERGGRL
jgi:hypothetical protein